jgi:hypothetical protein
LGIVSEVADVEDLEPQVLKALEQPEQGCLVGLPVSQDGRTTHDGDLDILECGLHDRARCAAHSDLEPAADPLLEVTHLFYSNV